MIYALIPAYDHWDKVTKCVRALNERAHYENLRTLVYYQHDHGAPAGFTKATNKLFQYAIVDRELDGVFIINDDTEVVTDNWVLKTLDFVRSDPAIGVVSLQELLPPKFNYSLLPYSRQRCARGEGEPTDLNYCGFGFCYITAECLRSVGLLDENFSPGYYEDYDFGVRAWLKGFKCKWYPQAQFKHEGGLRSARW